MITDNAPLENDPQRIEVWEVRDPAGQPHWIELDRGSLDDQLYLLRRLRDWAFSAPNSGPITLVRYHGPKSTL